MRSRRSPLATMGQGQYRQMYLGDEDFVLRMQVLAGDRAPEVVQFCGLIFIPIHVYFNHART